MLVYQRVAVFFFFAYMPGWGKIPMAKFQSPWRFFHILKSPNTDGWVCIEDAVDDLDQLHPTKVGKEKRHHFEKKSSVPSASVQG